MQKMAGYDCDFVDPVPDEFTCLVCLFPCRSPHVLSCCGVKICENCVGPIEASYNPVCPKCRERFTHFLEKDVDHQILGRNVRCSKNADGCEWIGQLRHLDLHVKDECEWMLRPIEKKIEVFTRKIKEEYWKEMAELREKYDALQQRVLDLEVAQTGSKFKRSFSAYNKMMALIGVAASVLLALLIYVGSKFKQSFSKMMALIGVAASVLLALLIYVGSKFKRSFSKMMALIGVAASDLLALLIYVGSKFEQSFSADNKMAHLIWVAASVFLALLIYVSTGSLLKNNISGPPIFFLLEQPLQMLVSQPLYILHQMAHWAMVYYALTNLECSHKLQPFQFWMAGMNLVFVLLYIAQSYLFPHKIPYRLTFEFPFIVLGLSYWFLIAKSSGRGLIFGYSIPYSRGIAEVAETSLPYYFSFAVLFNFWYKPFMDRYRYFFVRLVAELLFITYSCLIQTHIHENKYWSLLLELMVLLYMLILLLFPAHSPFPMPTLIQTFSLTCAAVFAISQIHGLISGRLTRLGKIVITVLPISFAFLLKLWNPHDKFGTGVITLELTVFYYIGLIVIIVVLMLIKCMIGTIIKMISYMYT